MTSYASRTASILARYRIQPVSQRSFSSLEQTAIRGDHNSFFTRTAKNGNRIADTKISLPYSLVSYDRSLSDFALTTRFGQPNDDCQLLSQFINNQLLEAQSNLEAVIRATNRNARRPKKANKGSRPCSRAGRRRKKEKIGKRGR
mmetsp:Transcript_10894/g.23088  ORF Transcript_10894/g.23088 Transcript_10894/m.23088 type:complete len:145 (+) Transcript_10894:154-588(+)